jgi:hypothetical protein
LSRGLGDLQWRLLAVLADHERTAARADRLKGLDTLTLAQRIHHGAEPTRSELVSIRRALATLMRDGKVSNLGLRYQHRHRWRAT